MILAVVPGVVVMSPGEAAADDPPTVVSLTFDDGSITQLSAAAILKSRGMHGTFYANSGSVGKAGYMSKSQLTQLADDGNEIGGHTLSHANLPTLSADEAKRQICLDRANLTAWGFTVRSFAYPFAETRPEIADLVRDCGYNSGRNVGDLRSRFGCAGCSYAESIPPAQAYSTRSHNMDGAWALQDYQDAVTNAESAGGGWVQLTFHNFCTTQCGAQSVTEEVFTQFLDWLAPRAASNNTTVKTVGDVVGGDVKPVVTVDPTPIQDGSGLHNPGLETLTPGTGLPRCWQVGSQGTSASTVDTVSPGRTGQVAGRVTVSSFTDGDARLVTTRDLGACAPSVAVGTSYVLRGWYTSTAPTRFVVHRRDREGTWSYWTTSSLPAFAPSPTYARAVWTTPPVPADTTAISFGLNLAAVGQLTVDDFTFSAADSVPRTYATVAPTAPDGKAGWYRTRPQVTLGVDLGSASATTEYSTNGGTTWQAYTAPFAAPDEQQLLYRSKTTDRLETARTLDLKVDTTAPAVAPTFNASTRTLAVNATDIGGSGVALIEKRVAGTTAWTPTSATDPQGDDAVSLDLRATDVAGNESAVKTVDVPKAPAASSTVSLAPGGDLTYGKPHTVAVTVTAPPGRPTPTGTVTPTLDGAPRPPVPVVDGKAVIGLPSYLKVGTHTLKVAYSGDAATQSSSAQTTLAITRARPTVAIRLSTTSAKVRKTDVKVAVTMTLPGSSIRPTGTVAARVGTKTVRTATVSSSRMGKITLTLPRFTKKGTYKISVRYGGSPNFYVAYSKTVILKVS